MPKDLIWRLKFAMFFLVASAGLILFLMA